MVGTKTEFGDVKISRRVRRTLVTTADKPHEPAFSGVLPCGCSIQKTKETPMAKGQTRSNREIRKPKKAVAPKAVSAASTVTNAMTKSAKGGMKSGRK